MLWVVLGLLYLLVLALLLLFVAGAAKANRRWDDSDRANFHSDHDHQDAA